MKGRDFFAVWLLSGVPFPIVGEWLLGRETMIICLTVVWLIPVIVLAVIASRG